MDSLRRQHCRMGAKIDISSWKGFPKPLPWSRWIGKVSFPKILKYNIFGLVLKLGFSLIDILWFIFLAKVNHLYSWRIFSICFCILYYTNVILRFYIFFQCFHIWKKIILKMFSISHVSLRITIQTKTHSHSIIVSQV